MPICGDMKAYFLSDIHLKNSDEPNARLFKDFLHQILLDAMAKKAEGPTHLFLVGDIFDLWIGSHTFFQTRFAGIVSEIRDLVKAGIIVHYFEGNHDLHLEGFWARELGAQVHTEGTLFTLGKKRVLVEHGDMINPDDRGYLFLRWFLRTPVVKLLIENLPSQFVAKVGERASRTSRKYTSSDGSKAIAKEKVKDLIHKFAARRLSETAYDYLITGHVHVVDDYVLNSNQHVSRSINLGSWYDGAHVFVLSDYSGDLIEIHDFMTCSLFN